MNGGGRTPMYSMDDVFERMQAFARVLVKFQDSLETSLAVMQARHEAVDPLWQDEARRHYDRHYGPLHETMVNYLRIQGPDYLRFLEDKLRAIETYLHGYNQ
jgi:hypothetical protein